MSRDIEAGDRVDQLWAVHRLTAAAVAAMTDEAVCEPALDVLITSLPIDRAGVLLFEPEGVPRFTAWRRLPDGFRAAFACAPWDADDPDPQAVVVEDIVVEDHIDERGLGALRDIALAEGIRAMAILPMLSAGRLIGACMLCDDVPHRFTADELALARTVSGHVVLAVEKRRLADQLRVSGGDLAATLNAVGEAITVQAPDGRLLMANDAAAEVLGFESAVAVLQAGPAEVVARFEVFDEEGAPLPLERLPNREALQGREPPEMVVRWRVTATGAERVSLLKSRPVLDAAGRVRFAVNVFRDVTDRHLALEALRASEARLAFLASASRRLLTSLEPARVLQEVTELVVPQLADWCIARELSADGGPGRIAVGPREHERDEPLATLLRCQETLGDHPLVTDLASGRTVVITQAMLHELAPRDEHIRRLCAVGVASLVLVPLRMRGRVIGLLNLAAGPDRPPYTATDVALAEDLAGRVAAAVANARSFATERATAETLARALLPGRLPDIPGLELAARYQTAGDVGGDFYDCFPVKGGTWMLVVGDVCGRGIQAASMTGLTRHTIRAAALHAAAPAAVLADLNQVLLDAASEKMAAWTPKGQRTGPGFCTVCLAAVTPLESGARVVICAAGHPLPFIVRRSGEVVEVGRPGSLLGVLSDLRVSEQACDLGPGDALVLFTDGITERRSGRSLFEEQLASTLRTLAGLPAAKLARGVEEAAVAFAATAPEDDMAVLVISVPMSPGPA